ncbi:MAG: NAD-dependent epimerase/dehydratase family protein [Patescibacteria group bacterium]
MSFDLHGKKILVAGAAGFLGTNVLKRLQAQPCDIRAVIHESPLQISHDKVVKADLTLREDCTRVCEGMDVVVMCAASTAGAGVMEKNPLALVTPNVVMNTLMLESAYAAGVKTFIFISSNAVYPPFDYAVKEEEMMSAPPFEKYYPISWMKRFGEILCETYAKKIKKPMHTIVLRPANMYGPYDDFDWETSHMVPALIRKVIERMDPLEVWGDGTEIKDLIYVEDFVDGLIRAVSTLQTYQPLNIGTGIPVSVNDVLHTALEVDGYQQAKIVYNTSKPTMIGKRMLDVSKAEDLIGFRSSTSLRDGIAKTISWYRTKHP